MATSPPAHSLTLQRGLRVLRVLANAPDGLSVSQLASTMGTHRAGIYRLLGPLSEERFVVRDDEGRYTLGAGLIELASGVRPRLQETALPVLRDLADDLRATTALTVRDGDDAVVAAVVEPRSTDLHIAYRSGLRHPLDRAASGIAILAGLPPRRGERRQVREARERGWAMSSGELLPGAQGVGVAVAAPGHEPEASISAVWIDERDATTAAAAVMRAATTISARLTSG